jgi:tripartite-type tricarboxylate transporter receptor subunit TctC
VHAQGVADFYRGKTISVLIGVNVGGGYDFEARLLARFMRAHIPGNPLLVPQNMIGAGGIKMANYLYAIAPQDGTAIGMFPNTLVAAQAVGTEGVQYDANRFSWLGSITTSPVTLAVWHAAGVQSIEDARKREIVVAASNKGAITYTFPRMLNEFLGTRFKIVSGYQGNGTMTIAMERGEVEGVTNSWDSWKSFNPAWVEEKKIKVLVQTEPKSADLAGVPSVLELARNPSDRQIMALIVSGHLAQCAGRARAGLARRVRCHHQGPGLHRGRRGRQDGDQSDRRPGPAGHGGEGSRHAEKPRRARQDHHRRVGLKSRSQEISSPCPTSRLRAHCRISSSWT